MRPPFAGFFISGTSLRNILADKPAGKKPSRTTKVIYEKRRIFAFNKEWKNLVPRSKVSMRWEASRNDIENKGSSVFFVSALMVVFARVSHGRPESKWDYSLELRVIRCFKMKNVKIRCDSDIIPGTGGKVSAELEILATDINDKKFAYGYGKSIEGGLCREHLAKAQALMKNQDQVCIGGDGESLLSDGETYARWRELETRLGKLIW